MKYLVAAVAALLMTTPASAGVVLSTSNDFNVANTVLDFDGNNDSRYTVTGGIYEGNLVNVHKEPTSTANHYLAGQPGTTASISGFNTDNLSFYWGSIDHYNSFDLIDTAGNVFFTYSGNDLIRDFGPIDVGNQGLRLNIQSDNILSAINFRSDVPAFEVDNIAMAVPEPATWAMMFAGFAMVGAVARRRSTNVTFKLA
jgi:hypothetical protein